MREIHVSRYKFIAAAIGGGMEIIMIFEPYRFVENLKYMGIGLLGVFMIICIIIVATFVIANFSLLRQLKPKKKKDKK